MHSAKLSPPHSGTEDLEERIVSVVAAAAFAGYLTFEGSGAALQMWTLAHGKPGELTMQIAGYHGSSRANCAGLALQETPLKLRRVVCVHYRYDEAPLPGTPIILRGVASPFGVEVQSFQVVG